MKNIIAQVLIACLLIASPFGTSMFERENLEFFRRDRGMIQGILDTANPLKREENLRAMADWCMSAYDDDAKVRTQQRFGDTPDPLDADGSAFFAGFAIARTMGIEDNPAAYWYLKGEDVPDGFEDWKELYTAIGNEWQDSVRADGERLQHARIERERMAEQERQRQEQLQREREDAKREKERMTWLTIKYTLYGIMLIVFGVVSRPVLRFARDAARKSAKEYRADKPGTALSYAMFALLGSIFVAGLAALALWVIL